VSALPLTGGNSGRDFRLPSSDRSYQADIRVSTPAISKRWAFLCLRTIFSEQDILSSGPVGVVNDALAHATFPGETHRQVHLRFWPGVGQVQIVGVIAMYDVGLETPPRLKSLSAVRACALAYRIMVVRSNDIRPPGFGFGGAARGRERGAKTFLSPTYHPWKT